MTDSNSLHFGLDLGIGPSSKNLQSSDSLALENRNHRAQHALRSAQLLEGLISVGKPASRSTKELSRLLESQQATTLQEAFQNLPQARQNEIRLQLGNDFVESFFEISRSNNPKNFSKEIGDLANDYLKLGRFNEAGFLYSALLEFTPEKHSDLHQHFQRRLDTMQGVGSSADRFAFHLGQTVRQTFEGVSLGSMLGAQAIFGLGRYGFVKTMPRALPGIWKSLGKTGRLALAGIPAFGLETLGFAGLQRGLGSLAGHPDSGITFGEEWKHAAWNLGFLKAFMGGASALLARRYPGVPLTRLKLRDRLIYTGATQSALLGGISAGHLLGPSVGIGEHKDGATTAVDILAFWAQFNLAGLALDRVPGWKKMNQKIHRLTDGAATEPPKVESRILLPGKSNSDSFLALCRHLKEKHPEAFDGIRLPHPKKLVKEYPKILSEIELARINSPERVEIAQSARDWVLDQFRYTHSDGRVSSLREAVTEYLAQSHEAPKIQEIIPPDKEESPGYRAILRHKGLVLDSREKIMAWTLEQLRAGMIDPPLARKIKWSTEEAYSEEARAEGRYGYFQFNRRKGVALVSGGAELAALKFFAEAGEKVLVIDRVPLGTKAETIRQAPGGVYFYQADLLTEFLPAMAACRAFAGAGKVDLGFYPYADGLVWLLSAASEAINFGVGKKARSVFTLRSPSVVAEVPTETGEVSDKKWAEKKAPSVAGLFTRNMRGEKNQRRVAQSIVAEQRLPYAVGNWLGKTIMVEAKIGDGGEGSAPVGPISWTGSMQSNPLIVYGLRGAHLFGVDIAEPYTSRDLQAFVWYHDFKNRPTAEQAPKNNIEKAIAATEDHADLGIFAQGSALGSLVYPAGITGILGVDGRRLLPKGLKEGKAGTYIAPEDPARLQKILQNQKGPLAWAFADHFLAGAQVDQLYIGVAPRIRKSREKWGMRLMNTWNKLPFVLSGTRDKFARGNKVFGKLLLTQMMQLKERGDQIHLSIDDQGQLASVFLQKPNGAGLEYRLGERNPKDPKNIHSFEQIIHLGKAWNGQDQVKQIWKYDSKKGTLRSTGPTRIYDDIDWAVYLSSVYENDPARANFRGLFGQPPSTSLTYPVNLAVRRAFEHILEDSQFHNPSLKIDPMRTLVHSIKIERKGLPPSVLPEFEMKLYPGEIREIPQGQLLDSEIVIRGEDKGKLDIGTGKVTPGGTNKFEIRGILTALVRGNEVAHPQKEAGLEDRHLTETMEKPFSEKIRVMDQRNLDRYGRYFDPNVLHQRPIVAQAAGFAGTPNPGVELMAEFETLIQSRTSHFGVSEVQLKTLAARFKEPLFVGQEYEFESGFDTQEGLWRFQIFEPGTRKVRVEGSYSLLEGEEVSKIQQPFPALRNRLMAYQSYYGFRPFPPPKDLKAYQAKLLELAEGLEQRFVTEYDGTEYINHLFSKIFERLGEFEKAQGHQRLYMSRFQSPLFQSQRMKKQNQLDKKRDQAIENAVEALDDLTKVFVSSNP